jgi:hypothetical protein
MYSLVEGEKFLIGGAEKRFNTEGSEEEHGEHREHREHRERGTQEGGARPYKTGMKAGEAT